MLVLELGGGRPGGADVEFVGVSWTMIMSRNIMRNVATAITIEVPVRVGHLRQHAGEVESGARSTLELFVRA